MRRPPTLNRVRDFVCPTCTSDAVPRTNDDIQTDGGVIEEVASFVQRGE
jgi:hypothetical protein